MRPAFRILILFLALSSHYALATDSARNLAVSRSEAPATEQRVALVIGNSAYKSSPLTNPVNDARAISTRLRTLGFTVIERQNLTFKQIGATLREFRSKLTPGAIALFFYAGHGLQVKGANYLPVVDADIASEEDVSLQSLEVGKVLELMDDAKTRLNLVFLDACRNNPYARSFRSAADGLAKVNAPSGTLISFATRPGNVAADGSGKNGLYTEKLLVAMNMTNQPIEIALKRVVSAVKAASNGRQEPWMEGSIEGDFCFGKCAGGGDLSTSELGPGDSATATELAFWESAERSNAVSDYAAYLKKFPDGQFVELAQHRIASLQGTTQISSIASANTTSHVGPVAAPAFPKEGDFWRYRGSNPLGADSPTYTVTRVDAGAIELSFVTNHNDKLVLTLNRDWNPVAQHGAADTTYSPELPQYRFPLEPGKKWNTRFKTGGFLFSTEIDYEGEVKGWETVTVPAGTFEALRIDSRQKSSGVLTYGSVWFSPEVRRSVKEELHSDMGRMGKMHYYYELEAFQLAGAGSSPQPQTAADKAGRTETQLLQKFGEDFLGH